MNRELSPGTHAAQWMLRRAWFRRGLRLPVIGNMLEHPWPSLILFSWVACASTSIAIVVGIFAGSWDGTFDQWVAVAVMLLAAETIMSIAFVWWRDGWAGVKKLLSSRWRRIMVPPTEQKWRQSLWVTVPLIFLVAIFVLIQRR